mgnify:CR=1 FL=1
MQPKIKKSKGEYVSLNNLEFLVIDLAELSKLPIR